MSKELLAKDINTVDHEYHGFSPLHHAVELNNLPLLHTIVSAGNFGNVIGNITKGHQKSTLFHFGGDNSSFMRF